MSIWKKYNVLYKYWKKNSIPRPLNFSLVSMINYHKLNILKQYKLSYNDVSQKSYTSLIQLKIRVTQGCMPCQRFSVKISILSQAGQNSVPVAVGLRTLNSAVCQLQTELPKCLSFRVNVLAWVFPCVFQWLYCPEKIICHDFFSNFK